MAALANYLLRTANMGTFNAIAELDLSFTQIKALCALEADGEERSVKALAESLGVSLPAMSRAVDGLFERGFVLREEDTADRRMKRVGLTEAGHSVPRALNEARLSALQELVGADAQDALVCGDINIAPADIDVFDPDAYAGHTHVTPPERAALAKLQALGLRDVVRDRWPSERVFTYWDYRAGMFHRDLGMRIDLVLASAPVAERVRAAWVDRQARKGTGPSDHAPVIVDQIRLHRRERLHELAAIAMHMSQQARHRIMQDGQGLRM